MENEMDHQPKPNVAVASARKCGYAFKPLIKYSQGNRRTEVVEQSPDRAATYTRNGVIPGDRYARGTTYASRAEAIAAAQRVIDLRREDAEHRLEMDRSVPGRDTRYVEGEVRLWGG